MDKKILKEELHELDLITDMLNEYEEDPSIVEEDPSIREESDLTALDVLPKNPEAK